MVLGKVVSKRRFRISGKVYHKKHLRKSVLQNSDSALNTNELQAPSLKIRILGSCSPSPVSSVG